VQTVLILPEGVTVTSGNNPAFIGDMSGGASTTVTWIVVFEKNGTHTLQVRASGYDSSGNPCSVSKSTVVIVDGVYPPFVPFEILIALGILLAGVLAGVFVLWKRRRVQLTDKLRHG